VNQIQQLACGASRHRVSRSQGGQTLPECRISNPRETAWRLREAALAFDLDGNLANSSRPPDVEAPWSRQWRKKPVAQDGAAATKRPPRRKAPNQSFLGWLASDGYDAYREPVTCLRTRENQSDPIGE
jgi:hypothetical protein